MPELPEVETIKETLRLLVIGKTIEQVRVKWPNIIKEPDDVKAFCTILNGQTIHNITRRGKFLLFELDDDMLVSHLRMEGKYGLYAQDDDVIKHTHVFFTFTDGTELRYNDVRKFGTMHVFPKEIAHCQPPLSNLGVEPLSDQCTVSSLQQSFQKTKRMIKTVLLDQSVISGLGNIYVDEVLHFAHIHPQRQAHLLTKEDIALLHEGIVSILTEAIALGGSTIKSYMDGEGEMGMFQQRLAVYGRKEKPCYSCGDEIRRIVVSGRGTHFCPTCQK